MPGRKKSPHHLKLVTGKSGRGVQPPPAEVAGEVAMPRLLHKRKPHMKRARELWKEKAATLIKLKILNPITATSFGNWCEMQARYESDPGSFTASMHGQLRALGGCFGMDYISWEKVSAGKQEEDADPAAGYFEKKTG